MSTLRWCCPSGSLDVKKNGPTTEQLDRIELLLTRFPIPAKLTIALLGPNQERS